MWYTLSMDNRVLCPNRKCYHYQAYLMGDCPAFYLELRCTYEEQFITVNKKMPQNAKYGLSSAQQKHLFQLQKGRCAICHNKLRYPQLDHNHKTNRARGYLCGKCNRGLVGIEDKQFRIAALAYLANPPAEQFYT